MVREGASRCLGKKTTTNKTTLRQTPPSMTPSDEMEVLSPSLSPGSLPAAAAGTLAHLGWREFRWRKRTAEDPPAPHQCSSSHREAGSVALRRLSSACKSRIPQRLQKPQKKARSCESKCQSVELGPVARLQRLPAPPPAAPPPRHPHKSKPLARDWEIVALSCNTLP